MAAMKAPWTAFLVVLSTPSAHAIAVHPVFQQNASRAAARDSSYELVAVCPDVLKITDASECATAAAALGLTVNNAQQGWAVPHVHANQAQYHDGCVHKQGKLYFMDAVTHPSVVNDVDKTQNAVYDVCKSATTPAPTTSPGVSGVGDPHLTNMYGDHFDLYMTGMNVLLRIPQQAEPKRALLLVEADTQLMGNDCSDLYFQDVTISGRWTNHSDSLHFFAKSDGRPNSMKWTRFDAISLKVVHGQTREGTDYLNVFAKNIGRAGYPVGGLLGADDHTLAATPPPRCSRRVSLMASEYDLFEPEAPHASSAGSEESVAAV